MAGMSLGARVSASFVALLASLALATPAFAQSGGTLRGTVVDHEGQPAADVKVVLESQSGVTLRYEITTNEEGQFVQLGVRPGPYTISVEKEGFAVQAQELRISARETLPINVKLPPPSGPTAEEREKLERAAKLKDGFDAGLAAIRAGSYDEAIAQLTAALETDPNCPDCHYNIGFAYLRKKDYARAEAAFTKALATQPDYAAAYQGLADVYNAQGKFDEAVEAAAQAAKLSGAGTPGGGSAKAVFAQGLTFWNAGRIAEAKEQFEETLKLDPNHAEAHYWLGMANLNEGKIPEAASELAIYLDREPNGRFAAQAKGILEQIQP